MKNHLKRIASPKSWTINRKENKFTMKPKAGPHPKEMALPLGLALRDSLNYAGTRREVKKLLSNKQVLVNGKRRKDNRFPLGLFDVLSLPETKESFRVLLDKKGRFIFKKVEAKEAGLKPCQIINKKVLANKKTQINFHDGRNLLVEDTFKNKVGDTVFFDLNSNKIKETYELKKGAFVFLARGKHAGDFGLVEEIKRDHAVYQKEGHKVETLKKYLFVLGEKKPAIDITL